MVLSCMMLLFHIPTDWNRFIELDEKVYRLESDFLGLIHHPDVGEIISPAVDRIHAFEDQDASREKEAIEFPKRILVQRMELGYCLYVRVFIGHRS